MKSRQTIGLYTGIVLFAILLLLPTPEGMSPSAKKAAAVTLLMATWWVTEAIPIAVTGLVPLVLFPVLGVLGAGDTAANYGKNFILLLLAGFFIAKAIETSNLHRRIALLVIKSLGTSRRRIILSFMIACAFLSMWIANVATALMMLPIGVAIIVREEQSSDKEETSNFGLALMLSIAYSCSIGGVGTLIGTPPNLVFAGVLSNLYPDAPEIGFVQWMMIGIPLVIVFVPITWLYLVKYFKISGTFAGSREVIDGELKSLGSMTTHETRVLVIFVLTALAWIFRRDFVFDSFVVPGWASLLGIDAYVHDATVAVLAAVLLFIIPAGTKTEDGQRGARLLTWKAAETVPWWIILIVGGGYAIANSFAVTGLAEWIGQSLSFVISLPTVLLVLAVVATMTFVTEINSNTATANIFLPILGAMAVAGHAHPFLLMIPGTIACTFAFMLPSSTGPNTVIFGSGRVTVPQMASAGLFLNFLGIVTITLVMYLMVLPLLGITQDLPAWAQ